MTFHGLYHRTSHGTQGQSWGRTLPSIFGGRRRGRLVRNHQATPQSSGDRMCGQNWGNVLAATTPTRTKHTRSLDSLPRALGWGKRLPARRAPFNKEHTMKQQREHKTTRDEYLIMCVCMLGDEARKYSTIPVSDTTLRQIRSKLLERVRLAGLPKVIYQHLLPKQ